jgi:Dolichyl-phosphate-mannose-protein mannosyltransferase
LERDEGEYAYIADLLLDGGVPYRDAFDQKPPAVFAAYALIIRLLGRSPAAIHWGAQIYSLGTVALVYLVGALAASRIVGGVAALLVVPLLLDPGVYGQSANTEVFMVLPLAAALVATLLAVDRRNATWALTAGLASGLAMLFKQVAATNLIVCLSVLAIYGRWRLVLPFLGGVAVGPLLTVLYFVSVGAWPEFFDAVIGHNLQYAARLEPQLYPLLLWISLRGVLVGCWPIYALALVGALWRRKPAMWKSRRGRGIVLAWAIASVVGMCVGGYFREHYYIQIAPAAALLAAVGLVKLTMPLTRRAAWVLPVATAIVVAYPVVASGWYYLPGDANAKCRRLYGPNPFVEALAVGRHINERSRPEDTVFIVGSEPQILFYANRRSASRFIFAYPLTMPGLDTRGRQKTVLDELRRAPPHTVVVVFAKRSTLIAPGTPTEFFTEVKSLLQEYRLTGAVSAANGVLLTEEEARAKWAASPVWFDRPGWCSIAIWERAPRG